MSRPSRHRRSGRRSTDTARWRVDLIAAVASGVVVGAAFVPPGAWPLAAWPLIFVSLVPLLVRVAAASRRTALVLGWVAGAAAFAVAVPWLPATIARIQGISVAAALPVFLLFVAWHASAFAAFGLLGRELLRRQRSVPLTAGAVAAAWFLVEWMFPRVFPWNLGDVLGPAPLLRQGADVFGAPGLGFAVALTNALVAIAVLRPGSRRHASAGAAMVPLILMAYGALRLQGGNAPVAPLLDVAMVQGNVAVHGEGAYADETSWDEYRKLTVADGSSADLVLWPETTIRADVARDARWRRPIEALVRELGTPLLLGAHARSARTARVHNVAVLFDPVSRAGRPQLAAIPARQTYRKQVLLPFGEYIPGPDWLIPEWRTTGRFAAGDGPATVDLLDVADPYAPARRLGVSICFEATLPGFYNEAVRDGATVLVNLTDDGWFGHGAAARQHLNAARMRAVEARRPLVRVANVGISAVIDPWGGIVDSIPAGEARVQRASIAPSSQPALYPWVGDVPMLGISTVLVLLVAGGVLPGRRQESNAARKERSALWLVKRKP